MESELIYSKQTNKEQPKERNGQSRGGYTQNECGAYDFVHRLFLLSNVRFFVCCFVAAALPLWFCIANRAQRRIMNIPVYDTILRLPPKEPYTPTDHNDR